MGITSGLSSELLHDTAPIASIITRHAAHILLILSIVVILFLYTDCKLAIATMNSLSYDIGHI